MRRQLIVLVTVLLSACAMPSGTVRTTDTRPSLAFEGAPAGATVYVDGILAGDAETYDGHPGVLIVEPGTHRVTVQSLDGKVLLDRKIYLDSEIKTIQVH